MNPKTKKYLTYGALALGGVLAIRLITKAANQSLGSDEGAAGGLASNPLAAYKEKIKTLQSIIGTTPDGIVGPKTKAALQAKGLTTNINDTNIDSVIAQATAKIASTNTNAARYAKAKQIFDTIRTKPGVKVKFLQRSETPWYEKDVFGNWTKTTVWNLPYNVFGIFPANKDKITWEAGEVMTICKVAISPNGFLYFQPKSYLGDCYPYFGTVSPYIITLV